MESCWYLQERMVHATKKSQYLTMQWTSQNHRGSLSLSLSLVFFFFVSYTCLHCCFLEMVCLFLFALRCCCCSCPIPFLQKLIEEMKHIYYFDSPFCSYREEAIKRIVEIIFIGMAGKLCESSE